MKLPDSGVQMPGDETIRKVFVRIAPPVMPVASTARAHERSLGRS
jgi:hypothetical protein